MLEETYFCDADAAIGRSGTKVSGGIDDAESLLTEMNRIGIDSALVYHTAAREVSPLTGNDMLMAAIKGHPRLEPCWVAMPHHTGEFPPPDTWLAAARAAGVRAVRLFPAEHGYALTPATCSPLLTALESEGMPLLLELKGGGFGLGDVRSLCTAHPALPIILTRVYWTDSRNLWPLFEACPNLYLETSLFQMNEGLTHFIDRFGAERLIFGTHLPYASAGAGTAIVTLADVSPEDRRVIAGLNLRRLLRKSEDPEDASRGPVRPVRRLPYGIVDIHGHIGLLGRSWVPGHDAAATVDAMNRTGISILCATSMWALYGDYRTGNDQIAAAAGAFPDRIVPYATANPNFSRQIEAEMRRCFDDLGMRAIKIHPAFHRVPAGDPRYDPVWKFADAHGSLVLCHVGGSPTERDAYRKIGTRYPHLKLLLAHAANSWERVDNYVDVAKDCPNVFLEITFSTCLDGIIEHLVEEVGADRVLFGTDMVWRGPESQVGWAICARLGEDDRRLVMRDNALRLLNETGIVVAT